MDDASATSFFGPEFYITGSGCAWRFDAPPLLSLNDWFIAGPAPGVHREEWLAAATAYRDQVRAGRDRVLHMDSAGGAAWLRPNPAMTETLHLSGGDMVYVSFRARHVGGAPMRLTVAFDRPDQGEGPGPAPVASVSVPRDGAWHDLELSVAAPDTKGSPGALRPVLALTGAEGDGAGSIELAGLILGLDDGARMVALARFLRDQSAAHVCACAYEREDLAWAAAMHACHFTFVYDQQFYTVSDGYRVEAFLDGMRRRFGGIDAVILWPAYPRIGVDDRNQFDFFRDLPGGLEGVRAVCAQFQRHGVRVLVPWLPWDTGTRREGVADEAALAALVRALDVDGIFLDTLTGATRKLRIAVDEARAGVALAPELRPSIEQLGWCNASWAQWAHDPTPPGMPLHKWIEPRHMQHFTRRWDACRADEIETAFFNGSGLLLWENIFGAYNPFSAEDALLWSRCISILRAYNKAFTSSLWDPFYPVLHEDVFAHRWPGSPTTLFTLRNLGEPIEHGLLLRWQLPPQVRQETMQVYDLWHGRPAAWDISEFSMVQVWGDIERLGCFAVTFGRDEHMEALLAHQLALRNEAEASRSAPAPRPVLLPRAPSPGRAAAADAAPEGMVRIPAGVARMRLEHERRECGCYPDPGTHEEQQAAFLRGHPHDELLTHDYAVDLPAFYMDEAQVTNRAFQRFLEATGYVPAHKQNFLKHWPDGVLPEALAELPVVYVDLDDARAYAAWAGKRLPTEPEWQRAAQGDDGRRWPWGDAFDPARCAPPGDGPLPARSLPEGRSPYGCYHMSGNVWEWTESERNDGITRFCIIRGGSYYAVSGSGWYVSGGPQPLDTHTKFLLMWPGLDRCATIGFRCVRDISQDL